MTDHRKREFYPGNVTVIEAKKAFDSNKYGPILGPIVEFFHNIPDMVVSYAISNSEYYGTKKTPSPSGPGSASR